MVLVCDFHEPRSVKFIAETSDVDILAISELEPPTTLAKLSNHLTDTQAICMMVGSRVPIMLISRTDLAHFGVASCAIAVLCANARNRGTL